MAKKREDIIQDTSVSPDIILDTEFTDNTNKITEAQLNDVRENMSITLRFNRHKINHLKKLALQESIKTQENVLYTELVKRAIDKMYFKEEGSKSEKINKGRVCQKSTKNSRK